MAEERSDLLKLIAAQDHGALAVALDDGADPDTADRWGVTLLGHAAGRGDLEAVRLLLDRGARVDGASDAGNRPLMMAAAGGHLEVMILLLDQGADPTATNKWGFGAADWASWPGNAADAQALLHSRRGHEPDGS